MPSFTFAATANSVALTGATPVFADIEPDHFCLDPAAVEAAITERTKGDHAGAPVRPPGATWTSSAAIADEHGLAIFEDAAQAHGATLDGTPVGTFGAFAMFSLYPTKNMTSGEGGMVAVRRPTRSRGMSRLLRNQGMERQYENEVVGFNTRMTDIHAAIGRVQLTKVDGWTATAPGERRVPRRATCDGVVVPPVADGAVHVYHQYTIRVPEDRDGFVDGAARGARRRLAASTTRSRTTGCRRCAVRAGPRPARDRAGGRARCCRCRCTPRSAQGDLERIVDRRQRASPKAGA